MTSLHVPEINRDGRVAGKTALVTGAGSAGEMGGTGSDIAVLLAVKGANVVIAERDPERATHTLEAIEAVDGSAVIAVGDVTDPASARDMVGAAITAFGGIDILVNNAAIAPSEKDGTRELWDRIIALNLTGPKTMSDAVIPSMTERGGGSIIHVSSIAGYRAGGGVAYTAAKGGLIAMTKEQAFEHGPAGIRVNTVAPGHVAIPMGLGFQGWDGGGTDRMRQRRAKASLLGTEGTGWDVAYAVLYLASDESAYVTAHTLPVDGGAMEVMPIVMADTIAAIG
jgi:NAD(P)-dependent dehydrogenase (short-subunit alcohol dehydrogenase family)